MGNEPASRANRAAARLMRTPETSSVRVMLDLRAAATRGAFVSNRSLNRAPVDGAPVLRHRTWAIGLDWPSDLMKNLHPSRASVRRIVGVGRKDDMERREAARVSPSTVRNQLAAIGNDRRRRSSVASSREFPSREWTSRFNSRLAREKRLDARFDRQTNTPGVVRWITSFARLVVVWWLSLASVRSRWESLVRAVSSTGHPPFARARAKPRELWDVFELARRRPARFARAGEEPQARSLAGQRKTRYPTSRGLSLATTHGSATRHPARGWRKRQPAKVAKLVN